MKLHGRILAAVLVLCFLPGSVVAGQEAAAPRATADVRAADILRQLGIELVLVKGGTYRMGDLPEFGRGNALPAHEVTVGDFLIGKTEVTQSQWEALMGANPSKFKGADRPVEQVTWDECQEFLRRLNEKTGGAFRLPTEAEWEYAARSGGRIETWAGTSNDAELDTFAWLGDNSGEQSQPVGRKRPNGLGIHDMSGNVWEWCSDWFDGDYYENSPANDPRGPASGELRVLRGGAWTDDSSWLRTASRFSIEPGKSYDRLGFRLAAPPDYARPHKQ